jgi:hypothetical protein
MSSTWSSTSRGYQDVASRAADIDEYIDMFRRRGVHIPDNTPRTRIVTATTRFTSTNRTKLDFSLDVPIPLFAWDVESCRFKVQTDKTPAYQFADCRRLQSRLKCNYSSKRQKIRVTELAALSASLQLRLHLSSLASTPLAPQRSFGCTSVAGGPTANPVDL